MKICTRPAFILFLVPVLLLVPCSPRLALRASPSTSSGNEEAGGDENNNDPPIPVDLVVDVASKHIWENVFPDSPEVSFVVGGSYATAVESYEYDGSMFPYNDIDVFVQHPNPEKFGISCEDVDPSTFIGNGIDVNYVENPFGEISDVPINVVILCDLVPEVYFEHGDINAVTSGIVVEPARCSPFKSSICPKVSHWVVPETFKKWLSDPYRTLEINPKSIQRTGTRAFKTICRLLNKAYQLGLPYKFPTDEELFNMQMENQYVSPVDREQFYTWPEEYQKEIVSRWYWRANKRNRYFLHSHKKRRTAKSTRGDDFVSSLSFDPLSFDHVVARRGLRPRFFDFVDDLSLSSSSSSGTKKSASSSASSVSSVSSPSSASSSSSSSLSLDSFDVEDFFDLDNYESEEDKYEIASINRFKKLIGAAWP